MPSSDRRSGARRRVPHVTSGLAGVADVTRFLGPGKRCGPPAMPTSHRASQNLFLFVKTTVPSPLSRSRRYQTAATPGAPARAPQPSPLVVEVARPGQGANVRAKPHASTELDSSSADGSSARQSLTRRCQNEVRPRLLMGPARPADGARDERAILPSSVELEQVVFAGITVAAQPVADQHVDRRHDVSELPASSSSRTLDRHFFSGCRPRKTAPARRPPRLRLSASGQRCASPVSSASSSSRAVAAVGHRRPCRPAISSPRERRLFLRLAADVAQSPAPVRATTHAYAAQTSWCRAARSGQRQQAEDLTRSGPSANDRAVFWYRKGRTTAQEHRATAYQPGRPPISQRDLAGLAPPAVTSADR